MLPLGLNIFTWNDQARLLCDHLQPSVLVFLDNDGGANEAANRYPNCKVIARVVNDFQEKHLHESKGATRAYLQKRATQVNRNVYINLGCEAPTNFFSALISETVDGLNWAAANNIKVVAPHGAWYAVNPDQFPIIDPLADTICARPDLFLLTVDEYSGGHAFSGVVEDGIGNETGHITRWVAATPKADWHDTEYWHAGRITNYFRYRQALGKPLPLTVITESGMDTLGDINTWLQGLKNTGTQDKVRGYKTLAPQWTEWYASKGWTPDQAYAEMYCAQWKLIYSKWRNVLGFAIYCYGTNGDKQWDSYRVDGNSAFFDRVLSLDWRGNTPVVNPVPKPSNAGQVTQIGTLVTPTTINARRAPTTLSTDGVVAVKNGQRIQRYGGGEVTADGYKWSWVELLDSQSNVTDGKWMALVSTSWDAQILVAKAPVPAPVFLSPVVVNACDFVSQYLNADGPNGCGPATLAVLVRFADKETQFHRNVPADANNASKATHRAYGATTSIPQLAQAARDTFSVKLLAQTNLTTEKIKNELDAGRIVGILYKRGLPEELAAYAYSGSHFGWISGYGFTSDGRRYFLLGEPLQKGIDPQPYNMLESDLFSALINANSDNTPNQGIFLDPAGLTPVPPPESVFTDEQISYLNTHYVSK